MYFSKLFFHFSILVIFKLTFINCYDQNILVNSIKKNFLNWKTILEFMEKYEVEFRKLNIRILQRRLKQIKVANNETNLLSGINFSLKFLYKTDQIFEFEENINKFLELNSNSTYAGDKIDNQCNYILEKFLDSSFNQFIFYGDSKKNFKTDLLERKLQLNPNVSNNLLQNLTSQQKINSNLIMNNNLNSQSSLMQNKAYLNNLGKMNNGAINNQAIYSEEKQTNLFGMFSITNPVFKMIISTVLMCLGTTPYGAIAVLIVVTVYTLIEIVVKHFYNKSKNKNIVNSVKRSTIINELLNNQYQENNITLKTNSFNRPSLRSLKKILKRNFSSQNIYQELYNAFKKNEYENKIIEEQLDLFTEHFNTISIISDTLELKQKNFSNDNITQELLGTLIGTTIKVIARNQNLNFIKEISKKKISFVNETEPNTEDKINVLNENNFSDEIVPNWYKKLCLITIFSKKEHKITQERKLQERNYSQGDWLPIKSNETLLNNDLLLYDKRMTELQNMLNFQTENKKSDNLNENFIRNKYTYNDIVNANENIPEMGSELNEKKIEQNRLSGRDKEVEGKWYDGIIKYSIQSYKQNGIRGVITMILDIFSTIFSATPVGYLIITLIRLIAFMTDKLLLLSRRRNNQRQLARILLELPSIFEEEKLILIIKEIGLIEEECNKITDSVMKLFKNLLKHLFDFNPCIKNKDSFFYYETEMFRLLQSKIRVDEDNKSGSSLYGVSNSKKSDFLDNSEATEDLNSNQGWTLRNYKQKAPDNSKYTNKPEKNKIYDTQENESVVITSKVIKEAKQIEINKGSNTKVKNSFQNMIGGLKSFLLNLFRTIFGAAGELWEYIKGILIRIIDFIKTLWEAVKGEKNRKLLLELIEEMPSESVIHTRILEDIINLLGR